MKTLTPEEKASIQTMAFCAFVMRATNSDREAALRIIATACTVVQEAMGLVDREVSR